MHSFNKKCIIYFNLEVNYDFYEIFYKDKSRFTETYIKNILYPVLLEHVFRCYI